MSWQMSVMNCNQCYSGTSEYQEKAMQALEQEIGSLYGNIPLEIMAESGNDILAFKEGAKKALIECMNCKGKPTPIDAPSPENNHPIVKIYQELTDIVEGV